MTVGSLAALRRPRVADRALDLTERVMRQEPAGCIRRSGRAHSAKQEGQATHSMAAGMADPCRPSIFRGTMTKTMADVAATSRLHAALDRHDQATLPESSAALTRVRCTPSPSTERVLPNGQVAR